MHCDVIVLGAGIVGVSAALHLQKRGRSVVLVDRRGAAEETSLGNAGLIQREGVVPYPFPRDWKLVARYALNRLPEAHVHYGALPFIAPWLYRYWRQSTPERVERTAKGLKPLVEACIVEHEALMAEAGITGILRRTGYLKLYRTPARLEAAIRECEEHRARWGVNFRSLDDTAVKALEPHLQAPTAGAIHMPDPVSVPDPSAVGKAYVELLRKHGGRFLTADARTLEEMADGWQVQTADGPITAREAVIAMGPWSDDVLRPLGYRLPLGIKRGYHMHYRAEGNAALSRPVLDTEHGYVLVSTTKGVRLTTGTEFALRDAPPTPAQLARTEPIARGLFPLGERIDAKPWLGRRPCMPDMLPMIGRAPRHRGLWLDFGHHHLGFTLGPVSGRLLADLMTGATPQMDPAPYCAERF